MYKTIQRRSREEIEKFKVTAGKFSSPLAVPNDKENITYQTFVMQFKVCLKTNIPQQILTGKENGQKMNNLSVHSRELKKTNRKLNSEKEKKQ